MHETCSGEKNPDNNLHEYEISANSNNPVQSSQL